MNYMTRDVIFQDHMFQWKIFNLRAFCGLCACRIWCLGRGFQCVNCKLMVDKKCKKLIKLSFGNLGHSLQNDSVPNTTNSNLVLDENSIANGDTIDRNDPNLKTKIKQAELKEVRVITSNPQNEQVTVQDIDQAFKDAGAQNSRQYNLNDFLFYRSIDRGSYGNVLQVELKTTKKIYALKVIKKKSATDDEDIDLIQTEKYVFVTASNYPFLVALHSCFQTPSRLCFVMEFVRGSNFWSHMQTKGNLPEKHACFYAAEISLALNFLHERGIIHRDVKLDNVLLDHEGHIKLIDYGMCKMGLRVGDRTNTFCGNRKHIAPEIIRGEGYDFSVDWWSLGVLLYEMLAGHNPFDMVGAKKNSDKDSADFLYQLILEKKIIIPCSISSKARSILAGFLNKIPAERLGCRQPNGFEDITSHAFFKSIDWQLLEGKQVSPPYNPNPIVITSEPSISFKIKPRQLIDYLTEDNSEEIENIDQTKFEGFEYVNPLLTVEV